MHNVVEVTVFEGAAYLTGELAGHPLPESAMADDVVEHLAAIDVFEYHVVMILVYNHLAHAADVRVIEEHGK